MGRRLPRKAKPLRRAVRHDGYFPINLENADQLAQIVADLTALLNGEKKIGDDAFDVAVALPPSVDPAPYAAVGATWWLVEFPWDAVSVDHVRGVIRDGPVGS